MKITISRYPRRIPADRPHLQQLVRALLPLAKRLDPAATWSEIQLVLVDDRHMQDANQAVFGINAPTDVISQRYLPVPPSNALCGEIILNVEQALRVAPQRAGWSPGHELALYLAHGIDHLHGADDATPPLRRTMRRRELRWLKRLAQQGFAFETLLP